MLDFIKFLIFLIAAVLAGYVVIQNTKPVDERCDYKECAVCPFPCERRKK